ncbi:MAG TPA: ABC transporter ATP-binding protein [Acidocella sp.]|jgi:branched-chain amino acid transport system ATP-binding protein|uniref:ABC transporter ATP-binding protein n=1 Tax=Acidocella sp. TaxID=50710 RepID=UPI002B98F3F4|nr:ABC transporter ATP-binding protein [Acidocella sp.]HVE21285.1 ABC transporter ATP-binding protein [Acidocella sp.]
MSDDPLFALRGISKSFGAGTVLDNLSLAIRSGERRGLIGPNGAGKTTLINIMTGKYRPDAGRIAYRGRDITFLPPHRRNRLGIGRSFQILSLFGEASVGENIRGALLRKHGLGMTPARRLRRLEQIFAETEQIAALVGLLSVLTQRVNTLPYGMQRRLDIALVLAQDPELIILDEPAAGLSAAETRDLIDLLKTVIGNRTLILVEHDMDVVYALADRITVLDYGHVLTEGTPAEVNADPEVRRVYLGEPVS